MLPPRQTPAFRSVPAAASCRPRHTTTAARAPTPAEAPGQRLPDRRAQQPARARLSLLHLTAESRDHLAPLVGQRHHHRREPIALLQIEFAQAIESVDGKLGTGCLPAELERDRVGPRPKALRMIDVFEAMLRGTIDSLDRGDRKRVTETKRMDDVLDHLDRAIKEYLSSLDTDALDDADHRRLSEIVAFSTNIEHAGDILERSLMPLAAKRIKHGIAFSEAKRAELRALIERLMANARAAAAVFMTDDPRSARQLLHEKEIFREFETQATTTHFGGVRAGRKEEIEAGRLQLDIIRDLKRVNSHLAAAAYLILENQGELLPSRLRPDG